jgi:hypothetical protein
MPRFVSEAFVNRIAQVIREKVLNFADRHGPSSTRQGNPSDDVSSGFYTGLRIQELSRIAPNMQAPKEKGLT